MKCVEGFCALAESVISLCSLSKRYVVKSFTAEPEALILVWKHRERKTIFCPDLAG